MEELSCIRVLADHNQIRQCRERIAATSKEVEKLSKILNLSGNQVRLTMLLLLYEEEKLCVCDLSDILEMKVPAVSQHLRKLKDNEMVVSEKVGQTIFYSISSEHNELFKDYSRIIKQYKQVPAA